MTNEEGEICAEIFHAFTGETIASHKWNDKAVVELYEMIRVLKACSNGMSWITSLPVLLPINGPAAARTALKYIYDVWKKKKAIKAAASADDINPRCDDRYTRQFAESIKMAAMGL